MTCGQFCALFQGRFTCASSVVRWAGPRHFLPDLVRQAGRPTKEVSSPADPRSAGNGRRRDIVVTGSRDANARNRAPMATNRFRRRAPPPPPRPECIATAMWTPPYHDQGRDKFTTSPKMRSRSPARSRFRPSRSTSTPRPIRWVRASLNQNVLPQPAAVRTEEMVNYFPYDYAAPRDRSAAIQHQRRGHAEPVVAGPQARPHRDQGL